MPSNKPKVPSNFLFLSKILPRNSKNPLHSPFTPPSLSSKTALILGHEVKGVSQSVVDACDGCLEIPQFGTKHSLNVSVAAGIVIWEFARHFYGQNPEKID